MASSIDYFIYVLIPSSNLFSMRLCYENCEKLQKKPLKTGTFQFTKVKAQ